MKSQGGTRLLVVLVGLVALGSAAAGTTAPAKTRAAAQAFSVQVLLPNQQPIGTTPATAPPDASSLGDGYAYPADGSIIATGALVATASTVTGSGRASAQGTSELSQLSLFGGEITADKISIHATAHAGPRVAAGEVGGAGFTNLVVLGQPVTPKPKQRIPLADWGKLTVLERSDLTKSPEKDVVSHGVVIAALDITLTADHAGLAAGSRVEIGYAQATAQAAVRKPKPKPKPNHHRRHHHHRTSHTHHARAHRHAHRAHRAHHTSKPPEPKVSPFGPAPVVAPPKAKHGIRLSAPGGYVFPVYGPVSFTDTFGAARSDVGWHHGDDIFAPLGAPIVAVANGTIFSVGWNNIGGNRLWLKDGQGNEFYYAHLSAFAPRAVNGARVHAGDVLGFVGNTGDAVSTPYHLHFEIHPVSMLGMGYDGVIDPTNSLEAWRHVGSLIASRGAGQSRNSAPARAPEPGAILVRTQDISRARNLSYSALRKVLYASRHSVITEGDNLLAGAPPSG
jgi:murein DD-endopeptidase MepM/ murein hydrolase activator NlpD